eukprot:355622-Chlamydomonas_euryale.AAC.2
MCPQRIHDTHVSLHVSLPSLSPFQAEIAASVVDPEDTVPGDMTPPPPKVWLGHSPNTCNEHMPGPSQLVVERFVWTMHYLAAAGFYLVIDVHTEDPTPNDLERTTELYVDLVQVCERWRAEQA